MFGACVCAKKPENEERETERVRAIKISAFDCIAAARYKTSPGGGRFVFKNAGLFDPVVFSFSPPPPSARTDPIPHPPSRSHDLHFSFSAQNPEPCLITFYTKWTTTREIVNARASVCVRKRKTPLQFYKTIKGWRRLARSPLSCI